MNICIAMDAFKGSLTSVEGAGAVREGILSVSEPVQNQIEIFPFGDGGEGTMEALLEGLGGQKIRAMVTGPEGEFVQAECGWIPEKKLGIVEMAAAAGLPLCTGNLPPQDRTTRGVGELMKKLLDLGCEKMLLCIGGSGTNEGGIGMLEALGFRFLNAGFQPVEATARHLEKIYYVEEDSVHPQVHNCQFYVACDVQNPLLGKAGATSVFGPQKGIGPVLGGKLEKGLEHLANITQRASGIDFASLPGAGAAGGMGFGAAAYLGAELKPGAELVMQLSGLETAMASADLLITGEGRLDAQTFMGKGPGRLALQAVKQGVRVWAFGGMVDVPAEGKAVFSRTFAVKPPYMPLEQAMRKKQAYTNLKQGAAKAWEQFCTNL